MTEKHAQPPLDDDAPVPCASQPAAESWFVSPAADAAEPAEAEAPAGDTESETGTEQPVMGELPQRTPGASRELELAPRAEISLFQPARATQHLPMPSHRQAPQHSYRPMHYTTQHPAPAVLANPAMPPYAAAQVPTRRASFVNSRPEPAAGSRGKRSLLIPIAAMAIASATVGALAQPNFGGGLDAEAEAKAHASPYDAAAAEYIGGQAVVDAPGIIVPKSPGPLGPLGPVSPAPERSAVGKHSNGDYDAPSSAGSYGGAHSSSRPVPTTEEAGSTYQAPNPAPTRAPEPAPAPAPAPAPPPEPTPDTQPREEEPPPTLVGAVLEPVVDLVTGVVETLTGIKLDPKR